jgi:hypothetical protein
MTPTPTFDDLTPPDELVREWRERGSFWLEDIGSAYRAGARHGWEQARQLWPEPITNRPPTEADGDEEGLVQYFYHWRAWGVCSWGAVGGLPWLHTPRWQPRQPSLQEQALKVLEVKTLRELNDDDRNLIRRALEQAGEGQA